MAKIRPHRKKTYRHTYSQKRTDTKVVKTISIPEGDYQKRKDGSVYPIPTNISVTKPTLDVYRTLREIAKYPNYDELLIDIIEDFLSDITSNPKFSRMDESAFEELDKRIKFAKINIEMRKKACLKADEKKRYYRRKTKVKERGKRRTEATR